MTKLTRAVGAFSLLLSCPASAHDPVQLGKRAAPYYRDPNSADIESKLADIREKVDKARAAGAPPEISSSASAIVYNSLVWHKNVITVCFWNGDEATKAEVMQKASVWAQVANINFSFKDGDGFRTCQDERSADIRVSLDGSDTRKLWCPDDDPSGDWSAIGKSSANPKCGRFPANPARVSLSLAALNVLDLTNRNFHIRHEFGHALGLEHEHQRDVCKDWFDIDAIANATGWSRKEAEANVASFSPSEMTHMTTYGSYDRNSIMQYNFALGWYRQIPGRVNPCMRDGEVETLSTKDIAGIQLIYGARAGVATASLPTPVDAARSVSLDSLRASVAVGPPPPTVSAAPSSSLAAPAPSLPGEGEPPYGGVNDERAAAARANLESIKAALGANASLTESLAASTLQSAQSIANRRGNFCLPNIFGNRNCIQFDARNPSVAAQQVNLEAKAKADQQRAAAASIQDVIKSLDDFEATLKPN